MEENTSKVYVGAGSANPALAGTGGTGAPLYVINLCASIAPIEPAGRNIPGLENYRLYQVSRVEDGRRRHRLRLGFFVSESHAESVLTVVRQQYPTAFATSLCDEDRRHARDFLPGERNRAPAPRPVAVVASTPLSAPAPAKAAPAPAARKADPAPAVDPQRPAAARTLKAAEPEVIELTWEPEPAAKAPPVAANTAAAPKQPAPSFPDDAGLDELTWEPPALAPERGKSAQATRVRAPAQNAAVIKAPQPASNASPARAPAKKTQAARSAPAAAPELTLSDMPAPAVSKQAAPSSPFHVGRGVQIADSSISLQADPPAATARPAAKPARAAPAPAANSQPRPAASKPGAVPPMTSQPLAAKAPAPVPVKAMPAPHADQKPLPELDTTQTIRALTSAELDDEQQEKWFAVQLAASEQPVNLDTMPRLDIFEAYRLYSVATAGSGKIVHSLRLGFFKEAVSAEAVCGYLKTFFSAPSVLRVSLAEHTRFQDLPTKRREAKREAQVVELNNARAARPAVPTVTMEVAAPKIDPSATGTFKANATGSHQALGIMPRTGSKSAAPAGKRPSTTARPRSGTTGKYAVAKPKSLSEQLLDEAREVELTESGIRKLPKNDSLLSRLVGKLTK